MPSILLLSRDKVLDKIIRTALPPTVSLQVEKPSTLFLDNLIPSTTNQPRVILMDEGKESDMLSWLRTIELGGPPVVVLISDLDKRQSLLLAGASDYLLKPLVFEEVSLRLKPYLQEPDIGGIRSDQSRKFLEIEALERLTQQIIQNERWITIGRLIAGTCHDITNRMQATQGALSLAAEEMSLSDDLHSYISICQQETRRVSRRVEMLRYIYHPSSDPIVEIDIKELLNDSIALATEMLASGGITTEMRWADDLPIIRGKMGQVQFVLLGALLNLVDLMGYESKGHIRIWAGKVGLTAQIEFSTETPLTIISNQKVVKGPDLPAFVIESALGLPTLKRVLLTLNGDVGLLLNNPELSIWFSLPII